MSTKTEVGSDTQEQAKEQAKASAAEQLWLTTATVAFNLAVGKSGGQWGVWLACLLSVLAVHAILNRWAVAVGAKPKGPAPEPVSIKQPWREYRAGFVSRLCWSCREVWLGIKAIPYVIAEASGTLFFLLAIVGSCCLAMRGPTIGKIQEISTPTLRVPAQSQ